MPNDQPIHVAIGSSFFTVRAAGVIRYGSHILLHKTPTDNYWSLPGGRVELLEFSRETLLRELLEETGLRVEVGTLVSVAENFFIYKNVQHHELGFYYDVKLHVPIEMHDFVVHDGENELHFRWFCLDEVAALAVYPSFVRDLLLTTGGKILHFTASMRNLHD
jgi:8-oxo-dGTP pyrophosphatase MutT (NUDIX family)